MPDAERSLEHVGEPPPRRVAVAVGRDQHVRGQRGEARRDLPDVQVVHLDHAWLGDERAADLLGVETARRRLEEDPAGVAQQAVGRAQHQRRHEQRGDRVGPQPARPEHDRAGDRGAR